MAFPVKTSTSWSSPVEDHKCAKGAEAYIIQGEAEGAEFVQPGVGILRI